MTKAGVKRKWGKIATATVAVLIVGLAVLYFRTDVPSAASQYQHNLDAAKRIGLPMTQKDVDKILAVPDSENAALLILPVLSKVKPVASLSDDYGIFATLHPVNRWPYLISDEIFAAQWPAIEPAYLELEQASKMKRISFFTQLTKSMQFNYEDYESWVRLIIQRAHIAEKAGDLSDARRRILTAARLSTLPQIDGTSWGVQIWILATKWVQEELRIWLSTRGNSSEWRQVIREAVNIIDQPFDLRPAIRNEYLSSIRKTEIWTGLLPEPPSSPVFGKYYDKMKQESARYRWVPLFGRANVSRVNEYFVRALETYPSDPRDIPSLLNYGLKTTPVFPATQMSMAAAVYSVPSSDSKRIARIIARTNVLTEALAILESEVRSEKLPLSGRFAMDSDGKPLRVKTKADGFVVYSVDGKDNDDGGVDRTMRIGKVGDFVVHLGWQPWK